MLRAIRRARLHLKHPHLPLALRRSLQSSTAQSPSAPEAPAPPPRSAPLPSLDCGAFSGNPEALFHAMKSHILRPAPSPAAPAPPAPSTSAPFQLRPGQAGSVPVLLRHMARDWPLHRLGAGSGLRGVIDGITDDEVGRPSGTLDRRRGCDWIDLLGGGVAGERWAVGGVTGSTIYN